MTPQELNAVKALTKSITDLTKVLKPKSEPVNIMDRFFGPRTSPESDPTKTRLQIPVFFMLGRETIDNDTAAAHGFAIIDAGGIHIRLPAEYYPDMIRQIVAVGDPAAITIGLTHRAPVDFT